MGIAERRLVVGFSPVREATDRLLAALGRVALAAQFQHTETLQEILADVTPTVQALVYAGLLQRVEIVADDVQLVIDICYYPEATEDDELEFANLGLLQIAASRLDLRFIVSSLEHAQALTAGRLATASTDTISLEVDQNDAVPTEGPAPVDPHGNDDEGSTDEHEGGDHYGD